MPTALPMSRSAAFVGRVDSSLITCEMARRQPAVQCFSVGYAEKAYSELPAARAAAQALGVPLTETTVTADDFCGKPGHPVVSG